jgi:hypothetical protein
MDFARGGQATRRGQAGSKVFHGAFLLGGANIPQLHLYYILA